MDLSLPFIRLQKVYFPRKINPMKVLHSNKTQNQFVHVQISWITSDKAQIFKQKLSMHTSFGTDNLILS